MAAAENEFSASKLGNRSWVDFAINVFDQQVLRWDAETCSGGLRWQVYEFNKGYDWKDSALNGHFFLLAARLAKFTGNSTYSEWAEKAFNWTQDAGLMSEEFHVFSGSSPTENCSDVNAIEWSSNLGIFTEGAAVMYNLTNGEDRWKKAVAGFVNASSIFHEDDSALSEVACERTQKCNVDQRAFKRIAARSFARAAQSAPFVSSSLTPSSKLLHKAQHKVALVKRQNWHAR